MSEPRPFTSPKKRLGRALFVVALCLLGAFLVLAFRGGRSASAERRAQLRARGERLSVAELLPRDRVTNEVAEPIKSITRVAPKIAVISSMGGRGEKPPDPVGFRRPGFDQPRLFGYAGSVIEWEDARRTKAGLEADFGELHEALAAPLHDPGWSYPATTPRVSEMVAKRQIAQALGDAILLELHDGNRAAALEHLLDLCRLVRVHDEGWTLVNQMIRVALSGLAVDLAWEALQMPGWTEPELASLQRHLDAPMLVPDLEKAFAMERASSLEWFDDMRRKPRAQPGLPGLQALFQNGLVLPIWRIAWADRDELLYLDQLQTALDTLRGLSDGRSYRSLVPRLTDSRTDFERKASGAAGFRYVGCRTVLPGYGKAIETLVKNETLRQLALAGLGVQRFRIRHGRAPDTLEALTPEFVARLPIDLFSGRPVLIKPSSSHPNPLLYSVGRNFLDDQGAADLDLVWPIPAPP